MQNPHSQAFDRGTGLEEDIKCLFLIAIVRTYFPVWTLLSLYCATLRFDPRLHLYCPSGGTVALCNHHILQGSSIKRGAAFCNGLTAGHWAGGGCDTAARYSFIFKLPCAEETNMLRWLLLTAGAALGQILSNGSFPGKRKMMYSLPGDRKSYCCASAEWCQNIVAAPGDSNIAPLLLHSCA